MSELPTIITYFAAERSLLPVTVDKVGLCKWRELQNKRLTLEQLSEYSYAPAWAHITGQISGLFTIDIDNSGLWWATSTNLKPLAHRRTPSGGLHVDVVLPKGWLVKNTTGALMRGVDTRGEGGIALIWGRSRKGQYEWLQSFESSPIKFSDLPLPVQWKLYETCRKETERQVTIDFSLPPASLDEVKQLVFKALSLAPFRGRNSTGFWLACRLRDARLSKEDARRAGYAYVDRVWSTNTHGIQEAYTRRQFDAAIDNAYAGARHANT